jgi:hypothetical protein
MAGRKRLRRIVVGLGVVLAIFVIVPFIQMLFGPWWRLSQDKLYVAKDYRFRQIFSAYIDSPYPIFITSDALLAAFHTLTEESAVRLESAQSIRLKELLLAMASHLPAASRDFQVDQVLLGRARSRASEILAVAMLLVEEPCPLEYDPTRVNTAVAEIVEARSGQNAALLAGLDVTRFKPRGFYTRSPLLTQYFRAVNWLQATSFDAEEDEQLLALLMLARASQLQKVSSSETESQFDRFAAAYGAFLGQRDDWDLAFVNTALTPTNAWFQGGGVLDAARGTLKAQIAASPEKRRLITDRPGQQVADATGSEKLELRLLSAFQLPDAILFSQTTDPTKWERPFPNGLEFCAALGSEFAQDTLKTSDGSTLIDAIEASRPHFTGASVYHEYCDCLSDLVNEPDRRAPAFLRGTAWQRKSCQTVLASWAQMRHTWVLQVKPQVSFWSDDDIKPPPGFVEPDPEFFESLAALCHRVGELFVNQGAYSDETTKLLMDAKKNAVDVEEDSYTRNEPLPDLNGAWQILERLCKSAARTAERQLAGEKLDASDLAFVSDFGVSLSHTMLYGGNRYLSPKDDAPRVVDLFANSVSGKVLHAAVGRPVVIFVRYPYQGREIYCRGAVLPYFEFVDSGRLDDAEWQKKLDAEQPEQPAWIKPINGVGAPLSPATREIERE